MSDALTLETMRRLWEQGRPCTVQDFIDRVDMDETIIADVMAPAIRYSDIEDRVVETTLETFPSQVGDYTIHPYDGKGFKPRPRSKRLHHNDFTPLHHLPTPQELRKGPREVTPQIALRSSPEWSIRRYRANVEIDVWPEPLNRALALLEPDYASNQTYMAATIRVEAPQPVYDALLPMVVQQQDHRLVREEALPEGMHVCRVSVRINRAAITEQLWDMGTGDRDGHWMWREILFGLFADLVTPHEAEAWVRWGRDGPWLRVDHEAAEPKYVWREKDHSWRVIDWGFRPLEQGWAPGEFGINLTHTVKPYRILSFGSFQGNMPGQVAELSTYAARDLNGSLRPIHLEMGACYLDQLIKGKVKDLALGKKLPEWSRRRFGLYATAGLIRLADDAGLAGMLDDLNFKNEHPSMCIAAPTREDIQS